jgi:hypothetical protein
MRGTRPIQREEQKHASLGLGGIEWVIVGAAWVPTNG